MSEDKPDEAEILRYHAVIDTFVTALNILAEAYDTSAMEEKSEEYKLGFQGAYSIIHEAYHQTGDLVGLRALGYSTKQIAGMSLEERSQTVVKKTAEKLAEVFTKLAQPTPKDDQGLKPDSSLESKWNEVLKGFSQ